MAPHQNQCHTTIKDIIHTNQLLHSITVKDKEVASTVKRIIGMINVRNYKEFRVENNKYMDYATFS